jgi:hypothetical protein
LELVVSHLHTPYSLLEFGSFPQKYLPTDAAHENGWASSQAGRDTPKDTPARSRLDMHFRTTAERVPVEWLKERMERRKWVEDAPPIPTHLR